MSDVLDTIEIAHYESYLSAVSRLSDSGAVADVDGWRVDGVVRDSVVCAVGDVSSTVGAVCADSHVIADIDTAGIEVANHLYAAVAEI